MSLFPIFWASLSTMRAIQVGSGVVCALAIVAMYLEDTRRHRQPERDAFAFDCYRATAAWCLWWCGVASMLILDPSIGAMALDGGRYTVASGTALLFVGHVVAAGLFMLCRLRELLGFHEWQRHSTAWRRG